MSKLLTIAIPTYNRASRLDKQIAWLYQSIQGAEDQCEIIISDNCSTDETPEIVAKWQAKFSPGVLQSKRNEENVGLIGNMVSCIKAATSKYVWTIGDDDPIDDGAVPYLLKTLTENPDVTLLILNFSCRNEATGELIFDRCYDIDTDEVYENGREIFEQCIRINNSGVGVMTAQVYRTYLAQQATESGPSFSNYESQVYWTGYCAFHGSVKISRETYAEYAAGLSSWMTDRKKLLRMHYNYLPEIYAKLADIGYSKTFCRSMILNHFRINNWRVFFGALRRWPILALEVISRYLTLIVRVCVSTQWTFTRSL